MQESYCLRWNSFKNNFINIIEDLYASQFMADVYLFCEGKIIKTHRMVLSACSTYFREIFFKLKNISMQPLIFISGVGYEELQKLIEFMYKGEINVSEDSLSSLLKAADALKVKGLSNLSMEGIETQQKCNSEKETECLHSDEKKFKMEPSEKNMDPSHDKTEDISSFNKDFIKFENEEVPESSDDDGLVIDELSFFETKEEGLDSMYPDVRLEEGRIDGIEMNEQQHSQPLNMPLSPSNIGDSDSLCSSEHKITPGNLEGMSNPCHKIPRPPNAFMVFANEWRKKLAMQHPGESNKEISVRLGTIWKNLDQNHKDKYFVIAAEMALEHRRKYPFYVYSPKEARLRKALRAQHRISDCNKLGC